MNEGFFGDAEYKRRVVEAIPLRRIATADDVAPSVIFLASDYSRHITGQIPTSTAAPCSAGREGVTNAG